MNRPYRRYAGTGRRLRRLLFLPLLLLAACEFIPSEPFTPVLNVQGFISAGDSLPLLVRVNRTYAIDEPSSPDFPDVAVSIRRGPDTLRLDYADRDRYLSPDPVPIRPGDRLELFAAHPGFDPVHGHTTVPDSFAIITPAPGDTITVRDSLVWSVSPSSRGYLISLSAAPPDTFRLEFLYPNDTLPLNIPFLILGRAPAGPYQLAVVAVDSNYYSWLRRGIGGPGGFNTSDSFDLVGGVGVFGSGVERMLELCLRCDSLDLHGLPSRHKN